MAVIAGDVFHRNLTLIATAGLKVIAARAKVTAGRAFVGQWKVARYGDQGPCVLVGTRQRDRSKQSLGIRMLHLVKDIFDAAALDSFAGIHNANAVAGFQNQTEVVRDKQHGGAVFLAQILDQFHHGGLNGHV